MSFGENIIERYSELLQDYLLTEKDDCLSEVSSIGGALFRSGLQTYSLAFFHYQALTTLLTLPNIPHLTDVVKNTEIVLSYLLNGFQAASAKDSDSKLAYERSRFVTLVERTSNMVAFTNAKGKITFINPSFAQITGHDFGSISHIWQIIPDPSLKAILLESLLPGLNWNDRVQIKTRDNRFLECQVDLFSLDDKARQSGEFVWMLRDITSEALLDKKYKHAQRIEAIGTLASGIAHDINNLLAIIRGYSDLVIDELDDSLCRANTQRIIDATERASDIINQILTFGRKHDVKPERIDPRALLNQLTALFENTKPSNVKLHFGVKLDNKMLMINPGQFHQILANLCINAFAAITPDEGTVNIILKVPDSLPPELLLSPKDSIIFLDNSQWIHLIVSDTGKGMDEALQERIFDPFFTTKDVGEGHGLGLSTVHGLVVHLGGGITVDSKPGKGTTFNIYLPILVD